MVVEVAAVGTSAKEEEAAVEALLLLLLLLLAKMLALAGNGFKLSVKTCLDGSLDCSFVVWVMDEPCRVMDERSWVIESWVKTAEEEFGVTAAASRVTDDDDDEI